MKVTNQDMETIFTCISAIATALMAFLTWRTLRQNRTQLNELKRQWEQQNSPKIVPSFVKSDNSVYLRLKNYSGVYANNVKIIISSNNPTCMDGYQKLQECLKEAVLNIEPSGHKDMPLIVTYWNETVYAGVLCVNIEINGEMHKTYNLNISELNVIDGTLSDLLVRAIKDLTNQIDRGVKCK